MYKWLSNLIRGKSPTPSELVHAAAGDNLDEVTNLLRRGVDPNAVDSGGNTGLRYTTSLQVASLLLSKGADVNIGNETGITPLHHAAAIYPNLGIPLIDLFIHHGANIDAQTSNGFTPLMSAILKGNAASAIRLMRHGANTELRNSEGDDAKGMAFDQCLTKVLDAFDLAKAGLL